MKKKTPIEKFWKKMKKKTPIEKFWEKIVFNSCYPITPNETFFFHNPETAKNITEMGSKLINSLIIKINENEKP